MYNNWGGWHRSCSLGLTPSRFGREGNYTGRITVEFADWQKVRLY